MKKNLFAVIMTAVLITGCSGGTNNSIHETSSVSADSTVTSVSPDSTSEIISAQTTLISDTEKVTVPVTTAEETEVQSIPETASAETVSIEETSDYASESTEKQNVSAVKLSASQYTISTNSTAEYEGITINHNSNEISEECLSAISKYFISLQNSDLTAYESFLIPLYSSYLDEYLSESGYNKQMLLDNYYSSMCSKAGEKFRFSRIELHRINENDYEEYDLMKYSESYIEQLNEISYDNDGTYISETFDSCYDIILNAYSGEQKVISQGFISVFESGGKYYIIMA